MGDLIDFSSLRLLELTQRVDLDDVKRLSLPWNDYEGFVRGDLEDQLAKHCLAEGWVMIGKPEHTFHDTEADWLGKKHKVRTYKITCRAKKKPHKGNLEMEQ